jgi:hypothetical protein
MSAPTTQPAAPVVGAAGPIPRRHSICARNLRNGMRVWMPERQRFGTVVAVENRVAYLHDGDVTPVPFRPTTRMVVAHSAVDADQWNTEQKAAA